MKRSLFLAFALLIYAATATADDPRYLFGGMGKLSLLGCLNCDAKHPKSVWNELSSYGFKNDFGIWNSFGAHANPFMPSSMCNKFSTDAPVITDELGKTYGKMSINEYLNDSVCGPVGSKEYCQIARTVCKSKEQVRPVGPPPN